MEGTMKKRLLLICIIVLIAAILIAGYDYYTKTIDTKFAIGFSKAFKNYDIHDVDMYLSEDTIVICNGKNDMYKDLRENVIAACNEKRYVFNTGSSYGYGNSKFIDDIRNVNIKLYGEFDGQSIGECNVSIELRRIGLLNFEIKTIACDNPIFEYLFYGVS